MTSKKLWGLVFGLVTTSLLVPLSQGQDRPKSKIRFISAIESEADRERLTADLRSGDPARIDEAMAAIRSAVLTKGKGRPGDLNLVIATGFPKEAEAICVRGIIENPANSAMVALFAKQRVRCLQAASDPSGALSAAKAFYNVCPTADVPQAVKLVGECLAAARPDDKIVVDRFQRQQLAGAFTADISADSAENGAEKPADLGPSVLASIAIDAKPFHAALATPPGHDYAASVARANLLLLSDKPDEAINVLKNAVEMEPVKKSGDVHRHMARALRAKHARTGPADAYLARQTVSVVK